MYVLPYGQMSLWGATVITNLMSAIPWVGQDIVEFIWGGFSVNNATLNRFFALHYVLPFILTALVIMHLIALHESAGSGNPLGVSGNYDRLAFAPYFVFKDLITVFLFVLLLSLFVFFMSNVLGDSENYVMANPMQTPAAIVPEWYLLPFYAILRSIPNKLFGVIAMFSAIIIILSLPFTDLSRFRGMHYNNFATVGFFFFLVNFLILMVLGAKHVESPFILTGQVSAIIYFLFFSFIPLISLTGNTNLYLNRFMVKHPNMQGLLFTSHIFPYLKTSYLATNKLIGIRKFSSTSKNLSWENNDDDNNNNNNNNNKSEQEINQRLADIELELDDIEARQAVLHPKIEELEEKSTHTELTEQEYDKVDEYYIEDANMNNKAESLVEERDNLEDQKNNNNNNG